MELRAPLGKPKKVGSTPAEGGTWILQKPKPWQSAPKGSVVKVTKLVPAEHGFDTPAVGYQYESGIRGVMPLPRFMKAFQVQEETR